MRLFFFVRVRAVVVVTPNLTFWHTNPEHKPQKPQRGHQVAYYRQHYQRARACVCTLIWHASQTIATIVRRPTAPSAPSASSASVLCCLVSSSLSSTMCTMHIRRYAPSKRPRKCRASANAEFIKVIIYAQQMMRVHKSRACTWSVQNIVMPSTFGIHANERLFLAQHQK